MDAQAVQYRRLGKSGLRVSWPILGMMAFGSDKWDPWVLNEEQALPVIKDCWDQGVNTWDTANVYSHGHSELIIAKALKQYNIPRSKVIILTKCHRLVAHDPGTKPQAVRHMLDSRDFVNDAGLSRAAIFNAVDASLGRMETDYIDMLLIHRYDPAVSPEEVMKALHDLIKMGKVRYIGACTMLTWQLVRYNQVAELHGWTKFIAMQSNYSLLNREDERELIAYCHYAGIGLIPWGPLSFGLLARPLGAPSHRSTVSTGTFTTFDTTPTDKETIKRVEELARKRGCTMSQISLAWLEPTVTSPIVGVNSVQRLKEAFISGVTLTPDERKYVEEPYIPKALVRYT